MRESDAHNVFGLSSGAVIALNAASALPSITKLAVYEPPVTDDGELTNPSGRGETPA